jgi:hypothetical protein
MEETVSALAEGQLLPETNDAVTSTETDGQETAKTFTQAELDEIIQKKAWRLERKAEREKAELKAKLEEEFKSRPKPAESKSEDAPKRDDFESYEDYIEARAEWRAEQKVAKRFEDYEAKQKKVSEEQRQTEAQKEFEKAVNKRIEAGRKEYADFDAVINDAVEDGTIPLNSELYFGIIDSDIGHKLAYHLSKHPSEAEKLLAMTPRAQLRELGKLEDRLSAKKPKAETMETVGGRNPVTNGLRDGMSMEEFVRVRNAQERKNRA